MKHNTDVIPNGHYLKRTACPYDCPDACGFLAETDGQKIFHIFPDSSHPVTDGFICQKMNRYDKTIYHKDRLLYPMKRIGRKGEGKFIKISWEEAARIITDQWKMLIGKYGASCILPYSYAGTEHLIQNKCGEAFFNRMGAVNLERTICSRAKTAGFEQMYGQTPGIFVNDIPKSDYIIMWGGNIKATWIHAAAKISQARKKGSHVVLIETYRHQGAQLADETFLVRPGSDSALALAMAKIMRDHGLIHHAFLEKYTEGYEVFLDSLDSYTPQWASTITGLPAEVIVSLALAYGKAAAPLIVFGSGYSRHGNGAMTTRCIAALPALKGAFLKPGGGYLAHINSSAAFNTSLIKKPEWKTKTERTVNMNQLGEVLCDMKNPIYSLYVYNSNPANIAPGQKNVLRGLSREDLFTVVHERFMTDTAKYADIILPADMSVEHGDIVTPYGALCVQVIQQVVKPMGQCKSNWDTFCYLAAYMGYNDEMWSMSNEEMIRKIIEEKNPWREQWSECQRKNFNQGQAVVLELPDSLDFKTESGRIMLYNQNLDEPLPIYKSNYTINIVNHEKEDWLALIVAPAIETLNSTFTERQDLTKRRGPSMLKLSTADALKRDIKNGDMIEASNKQAKVRFLACVTDDVPKGTVVAEGIYRLDEMPDGVSVNALLSSALTDYGRASTLCDNAVKVCKCS